MAIGERIQLGRRIAGMSQRALAGKVGVSATAISKYERNQDTPSSPVLMRLAEALDVGVEFLLRPPLLEKLLPVIRPHDHWPEKDDAAVAGRVQEWLERYLEIERMLAADEQGRSGRSESPGGSARPVRSVSEVEGAAGSLRDAWELGQDPIENLTELLENQGIVVGLVEGHQELDVSALLALVQEPAPARVGPRLVLVARKSLPGDQQRLGLARELARFLLLFEGRMSQRAQEGAERFARAFLVPAEAARAELGDRRHAISCYELHLLKHRYGISMQAWIRRSEELGILSPDAAAHALESFPGRDGKITGEPGDVLPQEEPTRLERMVMRALSEELISERRASELLGKPFRQFAQEVAEEHDGLQVVVCGRY